MRYFGDNSPEIWTHRPIDNLPNRVIIDANVLLDLALIVDGIAISTIALLLEKKFSLYTTQKAINEAQDTLINIRGQKNKISELINLAVAQFNIGTHDADRDVFGIKDHDSHLAAAAMDLDAFILTEDMPLLYDLDRTKRHGRCLRETLAACLAPDQPHQDVMIFGFGSGADGHIFMKFIPDLDLCRRADRDWYLFDSPGFMSIYYEGKTQSFCIDWEFGGKLRLPIALSANKQYAFCFNYSVGARTKATIKIQTVGSDIGAHKNGMLGPLERRPNGEIIIMNSRERNCGWKGSIQNVTFGPYVLNNKVWRASHSLIGVAPPTLTADLTQIAAFLTEVKGDYVRLPRRQDVLQLANLCIPGFYPGRGRAERSDGWFD